MKEKTVKIICIFLIFAIIIMLLWGVFYENEELNQGYDDGIEQIDLDSIVLEDSGVQVDFSEIIIGRPEETRKLIVSTQEAEVSVDLTDKFMKKFDLKIFEKKQKIGYTGKGYFVVDLDHLTRDSVIEDHEHKIITIQIDHAYLETIEIDPDKVSIGDVEKGWFARGDLEMTVEDYNTIEKELKTALEKEFDTVENGQLADDVALQMVQEVYEPVIKAIDSSYDVKVEFKNMKSSE